MKNKYLTTFVLPLLLMIAGCDLGVKQEYEISDAELIQMIIDADKVDPVRSGNVSFFDSSKGFGFIIDSDTQEKYFTHVSGIIDQISENDRVTFELEKGMKGMNAVKVTLKK